MKKLGRTGQAFVDRMRAAFAPDQLGLELLEQAARHLDTAEALERGADMDDPGGRQRLAMARSSRTAHVQALKAFHALRPKTTAEKERRVAPARESGDDPRQGLE